MAIFTYSAFLSVLSLFVATCSAAPRGDLITVPKKCTGTGFCSVKPEGYDDMVQQINELLPSFLTKRKIVPSTEFSDRQADDEIEDNCPYETNVISNAYLYEYLDKKPDIIVQSDLLTQQIVTKTCKQTEKRIEALRTGSPQCFTSLNPNSDNVKSTCQETFSNTTLLVYDPVSTNITLKYYPISVCCSCKTVRK